MSYWRLLFRLLLVICFGVAAVLVWILTPYWLVSVWCALFFALAIIEMIYFLNRSRRDLTNFLWSIQLNDFSIHYPEDHPHTKRLYRVFNILTEKYKALRSEKETNFLLLQSVLEHSGVPMLTYTPDSQEVTLVNKAMKELIKRPHLKQLSAIKTVSEKLFHLISKMTNGDKVMEKLTIHQQVQYFTISVRHILLANRVTVIVAMHNINSELDQNELESWQKLIRVMTHEIKNSVIPIATLSQIVNEMIADNQQLKTLDTEEENDLKISLQTIEKRSKGLVRFVNDYGSLAKVPQPQLVSVDLGQIVKEVVKLESAVFEKFGIELSTNISEVEEVMADQEMITQVLINLVKNACEALQESNIDHPHVKIQLYLQDGQTLIVVHDNGPGISSEELEQIFVPFYSTKSQGSGIGLSYSRQIMQAHRGFLNARSTVGKGTTFTLGF